MENGHVFVFSQQDGMGKKINWYNWKTTLKLNSNKTGKSFWIYVPEYGKFDIFLTRKF